MYFTLFSFCAVLLLACAGQAGGAGQVAAGREFKLKAGQMAAVRGERVRVRFVSVTEDSRCPVGVVCVWAGNAKVSVVVEKSGGARAAVELNTGVEPKAASAAGYEIRLVGLSPHPRVEERIDPKQYVATLVVTRK